MSLFTELQRRNVLRAVVLYAGAVWALAIDPVPGMVWRTCQIARAHVWRGETDKGFE